MEENTSFSFELRRYIALFLHWTWLIVLLTVFIAGAAYLSAKRSTPIYQASTLVLVNQAPLNSATDYTTMMTSQLLAQTYAQEMTTRPVLEAVVEKMGLDKSLAASLQGNIQIKPIENTQLMSILVTDANPDRAAEIANTLVTVFADQNLSDQEARYAASKKSLQDQMDQIAIQIQSTTVQLNSLADTPENQTQRNQLNYSLSQYQQSYATLSQSYEQVRLAEAQSISNIQQKEPAIPPATPIRPRPLTAALQGAAVGLALAAGLIFLIEMVDETVKDPQEITRRFGLPILGLIASHQPDENALITQSQPRSPVAEAFRSLRTNLVYSSVDHPIQTLLVTSPSPEDGKSTIAANLSVILAQGGRNVSLIDADLRKPTQHRLLGVVNRGGLSGLFTDPEVVLDGHLQKTGVESLSALPAGRTPPNPAELLGSDKMYRILDQVCERSEVVVIDSPPVLAVTDAVVLAPRVDGVLLVIKPGVTKMPQLRQSIEQLRQVGANLLGVVLNDVEIKRSGYKYYYYRSYYRQSYHNRYTEAPETSSKQK